MYLQFIVKYLQLHNVIGTLFNLGIVIVRRIRKGKQLLYLEYQLSAIFFSKDGER